MFFVLFIDLVQLTSLCWHWCCYKWTCRNIRYSRRYPL